MLDTALEERIPEKKQRLIDATVGLLLHLGYASTTVDKITEAAAVTKGSFFYYFKSKEEICTAAMGAWMCGWQAIVAAGEFDKIEDPLDRLRHLFTVMEGAYMDPELEPGCVVGNVAQELSASNESMRAECQSIFDKWLEHVTRLIADAREAHPPRIDFEPKSLAHLLITMVQGSMLVAKTQKERSLIATNVAHCRQYVDMLFGLEPEQRK